MVTKNLIPLPPAKGTGAAVPSTSGAVGDKENCVNEQLPKESDDDDKKCAPTKETSESVQPGSVGASDDCQGYSKHDVAALYMPTDGINGGGKLAASATAMPPPNNDTMKKRSLAIENEDNNGHKKSKTAPIDLSDVPDQPTILREGKRGSSKYLGVSFNKTKNKWEAKLTFDGKLRHIGYYDNEEDAAADYARAVFKYAPKKPKAIDLSDVPAKSPILKGSGKSGTSKYQGVCLDKAKNKWVAKLTFDGKLRHIGYYDNEEDAAADYARAVFKYAPKKPKAKGIDLSDVPAKPLILKGSSKSGTSKYQGVCFDKARNKWEAQIEINGKKHHIGRYDTEEEAAADYARVVYKYAPKKQKQMQMRIDLTDVTAKPPILKVGGMSGTSKYQGVSFNKAKNKWQAEITIDGKHHYIGRYDNEEEAAVDYARAVSKYKKRKTEVAHQQKQSTDVSEKFAVPKGSDKCGTSQFNGVFAFNCVGDGVGPQGMKGDVEGINVPGAAMRMHPAFRSGGMTSTHMTEGWSVPIAGVEERHPSSMPFSFNGAPAGVAATATNGDSSGSFGVSLEMPQLPESGENSSNTNTNTNTSGDFHVQRLLERNQFLEDSLMKAQAENQFLKDLLMKTQAPAAGVLGSADGSANQNQKIYEI